MFSLKSTSDALEKSREYDEYSKIKKLVKKYYPNITELMDKPKIFTEPVDNLIQVIYNLVFADIAKEQYSDERIIYYLTILKQEIEQQSYDYLLIGNILGIKTKEEFIQIFDDVYLYPTSKKENKKYHKEIINQFDIENLIFDNSFNYNLFSKADSDEEIFTYNETIQNALRLYKLGSIFVTGIIYKKTLIKKKRRLSLGYPNYTQTFSYEIKKDEIKSFQKFIKTFMLIFKNQSDTVTFRPISIALERFNWALLENVGIDRKLMYAVMGLEPLLLLENDTSGQSYALSLRLSQLLSCYGIKDDDIRVNIMQAYSYRNKVVHGRKYPNGWEKSFSKLLPQILNYLRITINFMLLNTFKKHTEVEDLINLIDKAIMNEKSKIELQKLVDLDFVKFRNSFTL